MNDGDRERVLRHVDLGIDQLETPDACQGGLGLRQRKSVGRDTARLELQVGLGPGHVDLAAELAVERGLQALREIRRRERQRQAFDLRLDTGHLVRRFAAEFERGTADQYRTAEWRRLVHRPGDGTGFDVELRHVDGRRRLGGLVAPSDLATGKRQLVDPNPPGRLLGRLRGSLAVRVGRRGGCHLLGCAGGPVRGQQVELPCRVARHDQLRRCQRHLAQMHHTLQRPDVRQRDLERIEAQQVAPFRIRQLDAVRRDSAGQLEARRGGALEVDLEVRVELAGAQGHGEAAGHVAEVGRQVQILEMHLRVGLAAFSKGRGEGGRIECAAVQDEGQLGFGLDLALRRQVAEKRHPEHEVAQFVLALDGLVVEVDRTVGDGDVVDGEARRLALGRVGRARELGQDVVDVVPAVRQVRQQDGRRVDGNGVDHRRQAQDRLQFGVGIDARHRQLGPAAVRRGNAQISQGQLERPGPEVDLAYRDLAAQLFAGDLLDLALGDRRHRQPGEQPETEQHQQRQDPAPHPFVLFQRSSIHRGRVCPKVRAPSQKQQSPVARREVWPPGLMADVTPMPSFRSTGS